MKIVRIIELPALEAAWLRLATWWSGLSRREQWLVGTLGVLLALAILVYGVVKPLQASRAQSLADIRTYETLSARVRAAGNLGPAPGPAPRTGSPVEMLTQSAAAYGLTVQVEATPSGVRATVADADYASVMNWMADVARTTGLTATQVDLRRGAAIGRVAAMIEYRG
ncbi:type II secretion system protein M [Sphingomonas donggukensis]|uniref:Type II secretion system protein M n=1 Tax=Sphingomonas donggukensis TaxID=2949093 RepID=A0ABY4TQD2_9SPHN|nr:type II secretion system protein M [Sphingomonas donggukensis]URW74582.1 type II secretion system protein M [Sphingomonas donggukensis]